MHCRISCTTKEDKIRVHAHKGFLVRVVSYVFRDVSGNSNDTGKTTYMEERREDLVRHLPC